MSTFGGVMPEFPDIRVDFFSKIHGRRPPLACFLSHVHSDHLTGLESLKAPFVYCSAATKKLLLRLERYPHRLNFALGILESRKQQYKHLKNLLKPIPLETPTRIELAPGNDIQITLFDANHCTGAVMFLIEGNGKAIIYTGDIRSEPWFVNSLTRNPFLIEYTAGLKKLDCIYLDTSNTQPVEFPTKADGLEELLQKVSQYPPDTVFHFEAWTFGYEEVWIALSRALKSPIHVDNYKLKLYRSLRGDTEDTGNKKDENEKSNKDKTQTVSFDIHEGHALGGFQCGNTPQAGCLTDDTSVRIHSCEKGMRCKAIDQNTVWIQPIIRRTHSGQEIAEVGIGGGGGDLTRRPELDMDSDFVIEQFLSLFATSGDDALADVKDMLLQRLKSNRHALSLDDMGLDHESDALHLSDLAKTLARAVSDKKKASEETASKDNDQDLPRFITFPYSRHSSYTELCHLVKAFNPKDVYPCTVDEKNWHEGVSMKHLFGRDCSANRFRHDDEMREMHEERRSQYISRQSQTTVDSRSSPISPLHRIAASSPTDLIIPKVVPRLKLTVRRNAEGKLRTFDSQGNEVHMRPADASSIQNMPLESPPDQYMEENIRRVKIAHPQVSELTAKTALLSCRGNVDRAIEVIATGSEPFEPCAFSDDEIGTIMSTKNRLKLGPITAATPPRVILAVSPTSESQNLRRKAIMDGLREDGGKRLRLSYDGHDSPDDSFMDTTLVPDTGVGNPTAGVILDQQPVTHDDFEKLYGREYTPTATSSEGFYQEHDFEAYWDAVDEIHRCKTCDHELWNSTGVCTGCGAGDHALFEVIINRTREFPKLVRNEYDTDATISGDERDQLVGEYLDYDSSVYDSMDELSDGKADLAYEVNSFIDDESQDSPDEEDDPLDGEPDYKKKFEELEAIHRVVCAEFVDLENEHEGLEKAYTDLEMEHEDMRRDFLGSDYESENSDEVDEDGALVIDIPALEPVVAEVVIEHAQGESQQSDLSAERIQDRVEAFEAANGQSWHNISMVSVRDNHTFEEVEL